jgi:pimeloyl-ACP methyl ester carboxylesterase
MTRLVLVHGAATTGRVWRGLLPYLSIMEVYCPDRPCSGDLDNELAALEKLCAGSVVVGVSGGATLGLALAARGVPMRAAVLHEPAAGSLAPGLLTHVADGLRTGGVAGFGRALYGPSWTPEHAPADPDAVTRDFAMFSAFEPSPIDEVPVLLTVGELSPPARHHSVAALSEFLGCPTAVVPGGHHAVHLDAPAEFARIITRTTSPLP